MILPSCSAYRALYILNWVYCCFTEPNYVHWITWISGLVQTLLYGDCFYYYFLSWKNNAKLQLLDVGDVAAGRFLATCFLNLVGRKVVVLWTPISMEAAAGGGTLSKIYQNARRLLLRTRDGLAKLERLESSSSSSSLLPTSSAAGTSLDPGELSFSIKRDIAQIQSLGAEMDRLWRSIGAKGQRDLWKRKVEQVTEEADSLRESLEKHAMRQQKRMQESKERAELLERASGESEHILRIFDDEAQAMQSARNSHIMLEEAYATGVAVLSKYSEQRDRLKRAQRKALDILNTVGLSNSVLKLIERRHRVDKWVAYAGMMITVVVMYMFWRWTH